MLNIKPEPKPERGGRAITVLVVSDILKCASAATGSPKVYFDLCEDLVERDKMGFEKYGQNLETHDGRDTLSDLYQEILDAIQYARKDIEERGDDSTVAHAYGMLIQIAKMLITEEERRETESKSSE